MKTLTLAEVEERLAHTTAIYGEPAFDTNETTPVEDQLVEALTQLRDTMKAFKEMQELLWWSVFVRGPKIKIPKYALSSVPDVDVRRLDISCDEHGNLYIVAAIARAARGEEEGK